MSIYNINHILSYFLLARDIEGKNGSNTSLGSHVVKSNHQNYFNSDTKCFLSIFTNNRSFYNFSKRFSSRNTFTHCFTRYFRRNTSKRIKEQVYHYFQRSLRSIETGYFFKASSKALCCSTVQLSSI